MGSIMPDIIPAMPLLEEVGVRYEMVTKENLNDYKNVIGLGM